MSGPEPTLIDVTTPESLQTLAECADVAIDVRTVDFDGEAELLAGKVAEALRGKPALESLTLHPAVAQWGALEAALAEVLPTLPLRHLAVKPERGRAVADASGAFLAAVGSLGATLRSLALALRPEGGVEHEWTWLGRLEALEDLRLCPEQRGQWDYPSLSHTPLASALSTLSALSRLSLENFALPSTGDDPAVLSALRGLASLRRVEVRVGILRTQVDEFVGLDDEDPANDPECGGALGTRLRALAAAAMEREEGAEDPLRDVRLVVELPTTVDDEMEEGGEGEKDGETGEGAEGGDGGEEGGEKAEGEDGAGEQEEGKEGGEQAAAEEERGAEGEVGGEGEGGPTGRVDQKAFRTLAERGEGEAGIPELREEAVATALEATGAGSLMELLNSRAGLQWRVAAVDWGRRVPFYRVRKGQEAQVEDDVDASELEEYDEDLMDEDTDVGMPYDVNEAGEKKPLQGVVVVLSTPTGFERLEIVPLQRRIDAFFADQDVSVYPKMMWVPKARIMEDIRFRGATGDFAALRGAIEACPLEEILFRANEEDVYGDATNLELALEPEAAERWVAIEEEMARRRRRDAVLAGLGEKEDKGPKKKKKKRKRKTRRDWLKEKAGPYVPQPWESAGSEAALEMMRVVPTRPRLMLRAERPRCLFNQPVELGSKDAQEMWNSSHMSINHFKDDNYSLVRREMEVAVQAVPLMVDTAIQATGTRQRPAAVQYEPTAVSQEERGVLLASEEMKAFLERVGPMAEDILQMNEVLDIFEDELAALGREGAVGDKGGGKTGAGKGREDKTFNANRYTAGKVISRVQWHPSKKGIIAVSCVRPDSFEQRVLTAGTPDTYHVLLWSYRDTMGMPELVLEAPSEVFTFAFNPSNPDQIAGGCYNGQVIMWDISAHSAALEGRRKAQGPGEQKEETPHVPYCLISEVELSHSKCVMDLQWLPGVEVARRGEVTGLGEDGAPGKDSVTVVTVSVDGNIMFWDTRADRYQQRIRAGREREVVDPRMSWVPMHSVKLMNDTGGDVACTSVCLKHGLSSELFVGSLSGLVLRASFTVPADSGLNPELVKAYLPGHCAAVTTLQLSPFFEDLLLTVGDWSFAIWKEGLPEPLFQSPMKGALARGGKQEDMVKLVCGCWSPTRPGVIFIGREDGHLDIWDLLDRSNEPSEVREIIMPRALTSLSFHPSVYTSRNQAGLASFLAIGDSEGTLHVHHLRSNLVRWGTQKEGKEREAMEGYWRREEARLSHRLARDAAREEREKEEADGDKEEGKKGKGRGNGEASGEELYDDAAQARYEELVEKYMVLCGLKQASGDE